MEVCMDAGKLMLENGAEIFRVDDTMRRIASAYGVSGEQIYTMTNGIIGSHKTGDGENFAKVLFVPVHGASLDKMVAVNALSREIYSEGMDIEEAAARLSEIRNMPAKPAKQQFAAALIGAAGFAVIFGGDIFDAIAAGLAGMLLWMYMYYIGARLSKIAANFTGGMVAAILVICLYNLGLGHSLEPMVLGTIIVLVPGIAFTNGIRDIANQDYLSGTIRLLDALMVFAGNAIGTGIIFMMYAEWFGGALI